ncbi:MAG: DUF4974 domain-containing protein [Bacteroidetes bacterium]|nr:DUF4974 domain-containing protein [Bacteroidota bacterium]
MNKSFISEFYKKYLRGKASKEEQDLLLSHYELFESAPNGLDELSETEKILLKGEIELKIRARIPSSQEPDKNLITPRALWISGLAVAASLLLFFTFSFFQNSSEPGLREFQVSKLTEFKDNRLIHLPDGSTVIISAGSKLNYPSSFDGLSKREVYLDGQAYFDVKHNSLKPFIIYTGKLKTTVLGTAFNISAWANSKDITVTVSRGKVKVEDIDNKTIGVLIPNRQIKYDKIKTISVEKIVESAEYLKWKEEEDLLLSDVSVAEAAELLEDRYQVKITISDNQIKSNRFTTMVRKGEDLDKILRSIAEFNEAKYQYDKDKATVLILPK